MKNDIQNNILNPLKEEQKNILDNLINDIESNQCAWISGYLWGIAQTKNNNFIKNKKNEKIISQNSKVTIISASQTGNARSVSEQLYHQLKENNIDSKLFNAYEYKFKKIQNEDVLIIVISTQGEGDLPEESLQMFNFLKSKKKIILNNISYSIFGLGDSSYEFFCEAGKKFDNILKKLGAVPILERIDADLDYSDYVKPWIKNIISIIKKKNKNIEVKNSEIENNISKKSINNIFNKLNPYIASISVNQKITGRYSKKDVRHIELDIENSGINYCPGDSLGIWYENDPELILEILDILQIKKNEFYIYKNKKINIFESLKKIFDITVNSPFTVKKYFILNQKFSLNSIFENEKDIFLYSKTTPFLEMIRKYPCKISAEKLSTILRSLSPRFYSISSSQLENEDEIHITVNCLRYMISNKMHIGGASGYLSNRLMVNDTVKIFVEKNNQFKLPKNIDSNIIMIGPGTGIAPFRSFMQERDNNKSQGKNWLFFGNPTISEDFLYQEEWKRYLKKGLLTNIDLAWSQDQTEKIYVQDKILEKGKELWDWIKQGSFIYVCGNASNMAKDVEQCLIKIISENSFMSLEKSENFLNKLREEKRYQRDIY
ncbi:assimilatory sulfite reductase (NADPH) flavoprotein subunit [Buchnera aphidicola (Kurisakia onigurumii)]|uniref:assimilatory sulfite reductase (NADPH) flavoprotein subunit n=1 Tax=Buchnera aphidicola TaxID=9 RepID=UPI0031B6E20D